jgi:hypothetical protein
MKLKCRFIYRLEQELGVDISAAANMFYNINKPCRNVRLQYLQIKSTTWLNTLSFYTIDGKHIYLYVHICSQGFISQYIGYIGTQVHFI